MLSEVCVVHVSCSGQDGNSVTDAVVTEKYRSNLSFAQGYNHGFIYSQKIEGFIQCDKRLSPAMKHL